MDWLNSFYGHGATIPIKNEILSLCSNRLIQYFWPRMSKALEVLNSVINILNHESNENDAVSAQWSKLRNIQPDINKKQKLANHNFFFISENTSYLLYLIFTFPQKKTFQYFLSLYKLSNLLFTFQKLSRNFQETF